VKLQRYGQQQDYSEKIKKEKRANDGRYENIGGKEWTSIS
jgi:hypothetical protein